MELEHLIRNEAPLCTILFGATGTDVPSLRTFLEILLGNSLKYDSDDIDCYVPPACATTSMVRFLPRRHPGSHRQTKVSVAAWPTSKRRITCRLGRWT
jgi:hypothetical protein